MRNSKRWKIVLMVAWAALVGLPLFGDDAEHRGNVDSQSLEQRLKQLEDQLKEVGPGGAKGSGIKLSGFVETSYLINPADRSNTGPVAGSAAQTGPQLFDNQYNSFNLNSATLFIQKDKDKSKFPAGFFVHTLVGEDANVLLGGAAPNDSAFYVAQAYVDLGIPIGNGIDLKLGKMASTIGYEVPVSACDWNFSRSDACRLYPPVQTGAIFSYPWNSYITSSVGVINGFHYGSAVNYNTDFTFIGKVQGEVAKTSVGDFVTYVGGLYGNDDTDMTNTALNNPNNGVLDFGVTWSRVCDVKPLALGFNYLWRGSDQFNTVGSAASGLTPVSADVLNGYAKWDWNNWTYTSCRVGYSHYRNSSGTANLSGLAIRSSSSLEGAVDAYSFTLTESFNIWKDLLIRVEWHRDWTDAANMGYGVANGTPGRPNDIRQEQDQIALNMVYSF